MTSRLKRFVCFIFFIGLLPLFPGMVAVGEDHSRVYDQANLFTSQENQHLEQALATALEEIEMELIVVTATDAQGKSSLEYADDFFDQGNFGTGENKSGALFLIDMDNRELYISTGGAMIDFLTDSRIEGLLDDAFEEVRNENYAAATQSFISGTIGYVSKGVEEGQFRQDTETGEITYYQSYSISPVELLVALAVSLGAGGGACLIVIWQYGMRTPAYKYPLSEKAQLTLSHSEDRFLRKTVTTRHIPPPSSGRGGRGGGGGGSSVHTSSGGRSHGGGGRSF